MSKILIMNYKYFILLFLPFLIQAQEVEIKILSNNINTNGSELNFLQVNKKIAYYSSATLEGDDYQSAIYKTIVKNGEWGKGRYVNLDKSFSAANMSYLENDIWRYFSACDIIGNCKIAKRDNKNTITQFLNNKINLENSSNTQPHITTDNKQKVLYFVSDRKGGFGGLDIWLSIIDKNGNYGVPINVGENINSDADEITPFYNNESGTLYFSSNKKGGSGGFDIYTSEGKLNLWTNLKNVTELNSKYDEMYLTFFTQKKGYLASNRGDTSCCNNIYSFEYSAKAKDTIQNNEFVKHLPLSLYFHNDEPDCGTMKTTTNKTYQEAYISYFQMEEEYSKISKNPIVKKFFLDSLQANFNKLNLILDQILSELTSGKKVEIQIKGYASPLHEKQYNINLSKRRIKSFVNYVELHQGKVFSFYLENGNFQIIELPFGENNAANSVSSNPNDKKNSIYGIDAMLERKIEIIDIKLIEKKSN